MYKTHLPHRTAHEPHNTTHELHLPHATTLRFHQLKNHEILNMSGELCFDFQKNLTKAELKVF